ncbi:MAG: ABC transporter ATP-binding protein [Lachnospiraceae bacterium]|nr:ABC transporter ATP-binding protein [Lachnospiraceae bacterium]
MKIQFKDVSFRYESRKETESVSKLNFTIKAGEFILICGPSGSGKSTVGRIINGLAPGFYQGELTGKVLIDGTDITTVPQAELAGNIGSVFQNPRTQFFDTNSTGELVFGCENIGYPKEKIKERIHRATVEFGLDDLLNRDIFNLSGGEKQKIACGSIYAVDPDVYVFDEPSSNLDFVSINELAEIMKKLKAAGKTIILIEHRIHYVSSMADRIFYINAGRIVRIWENQEFLQLDQTELHRMGLRTVRRADTDFSCEKKDESSIQTSVSIEKLAFSYQKRRLDTNHALSIQDLQLPSGKVIALLGKNGAGKSTFVKCMCGLEKGENATVTGETGNLSRKQRLKDSYLVMQDVNHQLFSESVEGELLLSNPDLTKEQIAIYLADLELTEFSADHPMALSGGQKQRVAVAAACAAKKKYLYLDEPTSGLDYIQMKNMSKTIQKIKEHVSHVLIVTHDPEFILECCEYVIELEKGVVKHKYALDAAGREMLFEFFEIGR